MSLYRIISLAKAQATQAEIESVVGYPCDGPDEQEAMRKGRLQGMAEFREKRYDRAMKGDTAAMTALGKSMLGETGDGLQININITDILKRAEALRVRKDDVGVLPCITTRSDSVMVDPLGGKTEGEGCGLIPHTEKNPILEN